MQFVPICLDCENFKKGNVCTVYGKPPFEIFTFKANWNELHYFNPPITAEM